jgi:hypothetical protein
VVPTILAIFRPRLQPVCLRGGRLRLALPWKRFWHALEADGNWNGGDWQCGDISDNDLYQGDFARALGAIQARVIVVPCSIDLYFPPEDSALEVARMTNAELRVFDSPFGHCVASPGVHEDFMGFLDQAIDVLLDEG